MAVVFVTRMENGETKNEGLCLKCAKELGIPQVNDILEKMGISDDDLENMENEIGSMFPSGDDGDPDDPASRAPAVDFEKLFGSMPGFPAPNHAGGEKRGEGQSQQKGSGEKRKPQKKFLSMYCRDLTADAREGKLDKVIGREKEVTRMLQILTRRQKNNPCLIGEAGVGKTAIAEALAQRIAAGTVPYKLRDKEVHLLDLTSLVAGTQFRGQFESRIKGLIEEVKALGNVILVIDEVHSIVGVGDSEGSMNAANILKPALSRGEVQIIGATTLSEYRKYIEKDTALERRFQPIMVEEPAIEDAKKILAGIKTYYETYHKIHISDEIVGKAVDERLYFGPYFGRKRNEKERPFGATANGTGYVGMGCCGMAAGQNKSAETARRHSVNGLLQPVCEFRQGLMRYVIRTSGYPSPHRKQDTLHCSEQCAVFVRFG